MLRPDTVVIPNSKVNENEGETYIVIAVLYTVRINDFIAFMKPGGKKKKKVFIITIFRSIRYARY